MVSSTASNSTTTEYRGKTRGGRRAFYVWRRILLLGVAFAFLLCLAGISYLLLFTHPAEGANLGAFYALTGFGSFFGIWAGGYLLRRLAEPDREHPADSWPCTRQALLGAIAIMIGFLLVRAGWLGVPSVLLLAVCVLGAEAALTWLAMKVN